MSNQNDGLEVLLEALRPTVAGDPAWKTATAASILSTPPPRTMSRRALVAVAIVGFGVVGAGSAYATGLIPAAVTGIMADGDQSQTIEKTGPVRRVFKLNNPDGTAVELFAAPNSASGQCWVVTENLPADARPTDLSRTCVAGPDVVLDHPNGVGVLATDSEHPGSPIVFGWSEGDFAMPHGTERVRVSGPSVDVVVPAFSTEGWAVEVPLRDVATTYEVRFLDAGGHVLLRTEEVVSPG